MFCVIQKIQRKKPDMFGVHKEIKVSTTSYSFMNEGLTSYSYSYSKERFERPILDAYKISIHHSYRENGKVKKKQWSICTMSYYDLLTYSLFDCAGSRIENLATEWGVPEETIYDMIYGKLDPLIERIRVEYEQTEEFKADVIQRAIIITHEEARIKFEKEYGSDTYKYCYDVFGELRNSEYLEKLKADKKAREEYAKRSYEESFKHNYSNYSNGDGSGYSTTSTSNYNEDEKKMLHEIYRMASKKFHPDACGDDGSKMKILTKLKDQWGL